MRIATHLNEEVQWLFERCCIRRPTPSELELLAGHLKFCTVLASLRTSDKGIIRERLLDGLVYNILFPASTQLALVEMHNKSANSKDNTHTDGGPSEVTSALLTTMQEKVVVDSAAAAAADDVPVAVHTAVRIAAFDMVVELCGGSLSGMEVITTHLKRIQNADDDNVITDFDHEPSISDRGVAGYVGLKNAGATCYMNSVLQQMYMQPEIRAGLLQENPNVVPESERDSSVLYQVQKIVAHLNRSQMQYYTPTGFWNAYRHDGEPVNMREQQDAHDFFTGVVDQIDEQLKKGGATKLFESVYGGLFADQKKIKKGCTHQYEREESFMTLQVDVRNFGTLQESLQQYVKGDLLEGANAYFCDACGEKRDTIKRTCLKRLPNVLAVHLKRFEFDWEREIPVKYNGLFEFPEKIDMGPYTVEGLDAKESAGQADAKPAPVYNYKLAGVTVHSGQANGGHYYSFVRQRGKNGKKWYRFDDAEVTECAFNESFMQKELFGGSTVTDVWDPTSRRYVQRSKERWWNGYLLFYEKVTDDDGDDVPPSSPMSEKSSAAEENNGTSSGGGE